MVHLTRIGVDGVARFIEKTYLAYHLSHVCRPLYMKVFRSTLHTPFNEDKVFNKFGRKQFLVVNTRTKTGSHLITAAKACTELTFWTSAGMKQAVHSHQSYLHMHNIGSDTLSSWFPPFVCHYCPQVPWKWAIMNTATCIFSWKGAVTPFGSFEIKTPISVVQRGGVCIVRHVKSE